VNSTSTATAAVLESPAPPAGKGTAIVLTTLIRREFWEHRALWLCPLIVAALLALVATLGHGDIPWPQGRHGFLGTHLTTPDKVALFTIVQWALSVPLYIVLLFCVGLYLCDSLYAERKDRSILFWKSLPVSDQLTVLAKLLTALLAAPLLVFALALAAHVVFFAIYEARVALGSFPAVLSWNTYEWLRTELAMLAMLLVGALWYAPIAAALLLLSVATRRPLLWATLIPILTPILENLALGTHYIRNFINYRAFDIWGVLALPHEQVISRHYGLHPVGSLLEDLNFRGALSDIDLWLGLAVAVALVYAAARLRRYRDEG
jgi:ABC-2 type transport system permease protein